MTGNVMIRVENLRRYFYSTPPLLNRLIEGKRRQTIRAVDGIDLKSKRVVACRWSGNQVAGSQRLPDWWLVYTSQRPVVLSLVGADRTRPRRRERRANPHNAYR